MDDTAAPPPPLAPVSESRRIDALDVARGLALLGIFCVNIHSFSAPFGEFMLTTPPDGAPLADVIAFYFVKVFCEGKFYPLFSTLFGIGIGIQWIRARRAGAPFTNLHLRRLAVLAAIGLMHGVFLWYGDILFLYAVVGSIMLLFVGLPARTLAIAGSSVLAASIVLGTGAGLVGMHPGGEPAAVVEHQASDAPAQAEDPELDLFTGGAPLEPAPVDDDATAPVEAEAQATPFGRMMRGFMSGTLQEPTDPVWMDAETEALREGPFLQATLVRALLYFSMLVFSIFGFGVQIVGMFMIGLALVKAGAFAPENLHWHRRLLALGAFVGLPLVLAVAALPYFVPHDAAAAAVMPLNMLGGSLMALGYLGAVTLWVASGRARRLAAALAPVGRMALTNYLSQTIVATFIMYHWGLGMFGETSRAERLGIVFVVFLIQIGLSAAWLRVFRFGPMEWVWRSLSYGRRQPMRRGSAPTAL